MSRASTEGSQPYGLPAVVAELVQDARIYVASLSLRREIATTVRQVDATVSDRVLRRVAGFAAQEAIILRQEDPTTREARIDRLRGQHIDAVAQARRRDSFEVDGSDEDARTATGRLTEVEWSAIAHLAQIYSGKPGEMTLTGNVLPFLLRASQIEATYPGI